MKIRSDFVTNSSSSNFVVEVGIHSPTARILIREDPSSYDPDSGGEAEFTGDLRDINKHLSSVEELATWLANSIKQDTFHGARGASFNKAKAKFIREACEKIKSVRDIEKITVERKYDAWGEFATLVADNDYRLQQLAEKYLQSEGIEKERAEAEMITYIHTTTDACCEDFGTSCSLSRYAWDGCAVDELAHRLCSNYGPGDVSGIEREELNMKTGEYFSVSYFDLE